MDEGAGLEGGGGAVSLHGGGGRQIRHGALVPAPVDPPYKRLRSENSEGAEAVGKVANQARGARLLRSRARGGGAFGRGGWGWSCTCSCPWPTPTCSPILPKPRSLSSFCWQGPGEAVGQLPQSPFSPRKTHPLSDRRVAMEAGRPLRQRASLGLYKRERLFFRTPRSHHDTSAFVTRLKIPVSTSYAMFPR